MTAAAMAAAHVAALPGPHAHPPFVPHLSYMEGQFATHALILEQQRRIKSLEAELEATRSEVAQLRSSSLRSACDASSGAIGIDGQHSNNKSAGMPNCHRPPTEDPKKGSSRYWTADEHARFLEGLKLFGQKDIKSISRHVGTRSATQVRTHAQKYYLRIERERAKTDGTPIPTGPIIPRERRCNQKGRPRSRGHPASAGSLSAESAGGEAGTSTNNGSSCTGEGHERNGETKIELPGLDCKFADDGVSGVDFKDVTASAAENKSRTDQNQSWEGQIERKDHVSDDMETTSSAKEDDTAEIVQAKQEDMLVSGLAAGNDSGPSLHRCNENTPILMDQKKSSEKCKMEVNLESLHIPETAVEACKRKSIQVVEVVKEEEAPRRVRKRSKNSHRVTAEGAVTANEAKRDPIDSSGILSIEVSADKTGQGAEDVCVERDKDSGTRTADIVQETHLDDRHAVQCSSDRAVDGTNPVSEDTKGLDDAEENLDTKAHVSTPSRELGAPLLAVDTEPVTWSSQLPPRGGTERGQIMGLLESGGSATNLRSLLQLPGTDGMFGSKMMTLRRNGSSNSVLADLPKHSGFLSRSNSFLISNNGKGVTRSSSILSLLSGLPTAMRESASCDRLLGLDGGNPDEQGAVDDNCGDFGDHNAGQGRLMSTSLLGRINGIGGEGGLGDRCLSFGQLHHMGVDDLEDAGAVVLSLSDDVEKWAGDGECDNRSRRR